MSAVRVDPPAVVLAERHRLGLDGADEMWEGELHMVPPAGSVHQTIEMGLAVALFPVVGRHGLGVLAETGLYDPAITGHSSYRVPDLVVFDPALLSERGVEGAAAIVVEIVSPGDESFAKLPYYERLGVGEVLMIDPARQTLRRWRNGSDGLVEMSPDAEGEVTCDAVPISLRYDGRRLMVIDAPTGEAGTVPGG